MCKNGRKLLYFKRTIMLALVFSGEVRFPAIMLALAFSEEARFPVNKFLKPNADVVQNPSRLLRTPLLHIPRK
jgi:hypothetical protein